MNEVRPTLAHATWTACGILFLGAATTVLAACLGFMCGIGLPLLGGPPGVAIGGAVFCHFWGRMILGREHATRCRVVGLLSLLLGAGLVVAIVTYGSKPLGDLMAFRIALGVAGMVVGAALGFAVRGRRIAGVSAAVGLAAWLVASVIAVPTFGTGQGVGPAMFLALLYAPGIGLTLWGVVMGVLLTRRRSTLDDNLKVAEQ